MTLPQKLLHSLSPHMSVLAPSQGSPDKSKLGSVHFPQMSSPLRNHGVSLVAQLVKNLSAVQETLVQFLGQEDSLENG